MGDPPRLHGLYYQWTRKVNAKTVSRQLTPPATRLYQEWIANRRELQHILAKMEETST